MRWPARLAALTVAILLTASTAPAHIVITEPNGGEVFFAGEVVSIKWCIAITHTLLDWDLSYHTALPGAQASCVNVTPGFVPIVLNLPPTCSGPGGGGICFLDPDPPCCMEYLWTIPDGIDSDEVKIKIKMDNSGTDYFDTTDMPFTILSSTSAPQTSGPWVFALEQNEPNPFRPYTMISYVLERNASSTRLVVIDARGALVRTLVDRERPAGRHSVHWDGTNDGGARVASGIYFYRLESGDRSETRKMVLLR